MKTKTIDYTSIATIISILAVVVLLVLYIITDISNSITKTTTDNQDFKPWFDKPKSEWTEKDNRDYMEHQIERINEKAENEKYE